MSAGYDFPVIPVIDTGVSTPQGFQQDVYAAPWIAPIPELPQGYDPFGTQGTVDIQSIVRSTETPSLFQQVSSQLQGSPEDAAEAELEVQALKNRLGIDPNTLEFGPDGHPKLSADDRSRIMATAMGVLGSGMLAGLATADWGGITKGLAAGMAGASEAAREEKDRITNRKMTSDKWKRDRASDLLGLEEAEIKLKNLKEDDARRKAFRTALAKETNTYHELYVKTINEAPSPEALTPEQKKVYELEKAQLLNEANHARLLMSSGDIPTMLEGIQKYSDLSLKVPGMQKVLGERMAAMLGQQAVAQGDVERLGRSKFNQEAIARTGFDTPLNLNAEGVLTPVPWHEQQNVAIARDAARNRSLFGPLGRGLGLLGNQELSEAERRQAEIDRAALSQEFNSMAGLFTSQADYIRSIKGVDASRPDISLILDATSSVETNTTKNFKENGGNFFTLARQMGVDMTQIPPGSDGKPSIDLIKAATHAKARQMIADLEQQGFMYDQKTGKFISQNGVMDFRDPDSIAQGAAGVIARRQAGAVLSADQEIELNRILINNFMPRIQNLVKTVGRGNAAVAASAITKGAGGIEVRRLIDDLRPYLGIPEGGMNTRDFDTLATQALARFIYDPNRP